MPGIANSSGSSAGLEAISSALAAFADENNISAITRLNGQLGQLGTAMNIRSMPALIDQLQQLGKITEAQAAQLRQLNDSREFNKWLDNLTKQWKGIGQSLSAGDLFGALRRLGPAIGALEGPIGTVAGAALQAPTALINLGKQLESFAAKANPAAAFQFNRALDDLNATIGSILMPIFEALTDVIRAFSGVLYDLKPMFDLLTKTVGEALKFIGKAINEVRKLFGGGETPPPAARPALYGSIADIGKRTTLNVLNNQSNKKDAADETKSLHETIKDAIRKWEVRKSDADRIGRKLFPNLNDQDREKYNRWLANKIGEYGGED